MWWEKMLQICYKQSRTVTSYYFCKCMVLYGYCKMLQNLLQIVYDHKKYEVKYKVKSYK